MRWAVNRLLIWLGVLAGSASAFPAGISIADHSAAPGSSVLLPVMLSADDGSLGALQFDLSYDNSVMSVTATLAGASRASGKFLLSADIAPGTKRFLIFGWNENTISAGILVNVFVSLPSSAPSGTYELVVSNVGGTDPCGMFALAVGGSATFIVDPSAGPSEPLLSAGVLNLASLTPGAVAPGEAVALIGSGIGPPAAVSVAGEPVTGDASVAFDGTPAPILYAAPNEIHAIVPYEVAGETISNLQVLSGGNITVMMNVPVAPASPALFTANGSGAGPGVILNQDVSLNSPGNPASAGSVVVLYATGVGVTDPPGTDGTITGNTPTHPVLTIGVAIGGVEAEILYAGSAPDLVSGIMQIECRVPEGASGPAVPVVLEVGGWTSGSGVTIAVE